MIRAKVGKISHVQRRACPVTRNWLIAFACILSVVIVLGCQPKRTLTKEEVFEANFRLFEPPNAPRQEVQQNLVDQIPLRLRSLKPGMTPGQVFQALNLPDNVGCFAGDGPSEWYRLGFQLRTNQFMTLRFNMLHQPPTFIDAALSGEGWGDLRR
jgi:hypothetical protein